MKKVIERKMWGPPGEGGGEVQLYISSEKIWRRLTGLNAVFKSFSGEAPIFGNCL